MVTAIYTVACMNTHGSLTGVVCARPFEVLPLDVFDGMGVGCGDVLCVLDGKGVYVLLGLFLGYIPLVDGGPGIFQHVV